MITEDYVSFETAKLLKERGFDCECHGYFWIAKDGNAILDYSYSEMDSNADMLYYSAPTLQMAMKWLRKKYNFHIYTRPVWKDVEVQYGEWEEAVAGFDWFIESLLDNSVSKMSKEPLSTYEEAREAAIKYCLENLI